MQRYLVTGTDTDVGKTRVTAALARAMREAGEAPAIVKLVQTGLSPGATGDAQRAGTLSGCRYFEVARFSKGADPWSAALAEGMPPVHAEDLAFALAGIAGPLVAEGAGGLAVPLNAAQNFAGVAALASLTIVLAVGLRLGCMNHALLTAALCEQLRLPLIGCVLVDRWGYSSPPYEEDVRRVLRGKVPVLGTLPYDCDEQGAVERGAHLLLPLVQRKDR
jgi:dethiobiotin synthetase